jgi:hypothetical protein
LKPQLDQTAARGVGRVVGVRGSPPPDASSVGRRQITVADIGRASPGAGSGVDACCDGSDDDDGAEDRAGCGAPQAMQKRSPACTSAPQRGQGSGSPEAWEPEEASLTAGVDVPLAAPAVGCSSWSRAGVWVVGVGAAVCSQDGGAGGDGRCSRGGKGIRTVAPSGGVDGSVADELTSGNAEAWAGLSGA